MKLTGILGSASLAVLAMAGSAHAADKYVVGVSNTLIGNGWREEMICSIKAEAQASGKVSKVVVANRNGGPSEQIADIRNLISAGANIIIINPSDREALNPSSSRRPTRASSWSRSTRRFRRRRPMF